ncbi:MAG: hypothetical protein BWZ02_01333 [Lentisphaerae bacterium ADurb.BinA184]|nr:MAG: hypothetical protein BWZ02_01333 [Lentisphaerae bacterium ADurb.BinA184]
MSARGLLLPGIIAVLAGLPAAGAVNVIGLFRDRMVVQRDAELPVWGWGTPGEALTVEFAGAKSATEVDGEGRWKVTLGRLPAGGPHEMRITQGAATVTLTDILVGEVWIGSGQSNMQWGLKNMNHAAEEIAAADYPDIRFLTIQGTAERPPRGIPCGSLEWFPCTPATAGNLSAVAYFFARELHNHLKVPIGLIITAQGASPIRSWISAETMQANPIFKETLEDYTSVPGRYKAFREKYDAYEQSLVKSKEDGSQPLPWPGAFEGDRSPGPYFYGRVYPLAPFAMRGVIWYQGENETMSFLFPARPERRNNSRTYKEFFPVMIQEWRSLWGRDFPFLYVQLAPANVPPKAPVMESGWAEVRDGQRRTLSVRNTAMVVTADICEPDLHPRNKVDVGRRLALAARALAYEEDLVYSGPILERVEFRGREAVLAFAHVGGGLVVKGERLEGFAVAGADRVFHWADAEIRGDTVVVRSNEVAAPVAVRYAYSDFPFGNLFNQEGLPASCFRTDEW